MCIHAEPENIILTMDIEPFGKNTGFFINDVLIYEF